MFHLNPSSLEMKSKTTIGNFAVPGWEVESFIQRSAIGCRLRVLDSGSAGERELDWAGRIRQKLIYVMYQHT